MEPIEHVIAVRRGWRVIMLFTVLGIVSGLIAAYIEAPSYRATSSVMLTPTSTTVQSNDLGSIDAFMNRQIHSYASLTASPIVLDPIIAENDLSLTSQELAQQVTAEVPIDTMVVQIDAIAPDPVEAADLANSVASKLTDAVSQVAPRGAADAPAVEFKTVGVATPPEFQESPNKRLRLALGAFAGLFLGLLAAIARYSVSLRGSAGKAPRP